MRKFLFFSLICLIIGGCSANLVGCINQVVKKAGEDIIDNIDQTEYTIGDFFVPDQQVISEAFSLAEAEPKSITNKSPLWLNLSDVLKRQLLFLNLNLPSNLTSLEFTYDGNVKYPFVAKNHYETITCQVRHNDKIRTKRIKVQILDVAALASNLITTKSVVIQPTPNNSTSLLDSNIQTEIIDQVRNQNQLLKYIPGFATLFPDTNKHLVPGVSIPVKVDLAFDKQTVKHEMTLYVTLARTAKNVQTYFNTLLADLPLLKSYLVITNPFQAGESQQDKKSDLQVSFLQLGGLNLADVKRLQFAAGAYPQQPGQQGETNAGVISITSTSAKQSVLVSAGDKIKIIEQATAEQIATEISTRNITLQTQDPNFNPSLKVPLTITSVKAAIKHANPNLLDDDLKFLTLDPVRLKLNQPVLVNASIKLFNPAYPQQVNIFFDLTWKN